MKLTQCLIVKNEEQNLPQALNWGKRLFDELIVVDTGSSDGTVAIAEKSGAKVLQFEWIDDFSAAKNFAIGQCTGDWIFLLDADEYFEEKDVELLRPLIEKVSKLYSRRNGKNYKYNVIETPWINIGNKNISKQARIFRNVPYLRYSGAIHERLQSLPGGHVSVYSADAPAIYHTGYVWSEAGSKEKKGARNFRTAIKALAKSPDSSKLRLFAAEALMYEGKYGEADKYFSQAMKNTDRSIWPERIREGYKQWLNNYMNMGNSGLEYSTEILVSALHVYSEAVAKFPDDADFDILVSLLFLKANDSKNTIRFFNNALSKNGGKISEKFMASDSKIYEKLRTICGKLNG